MDLIFWRHAEAQALPEDDVRVSSDLARVLTARGEKQAARMAVWLDRQLPESTRILVSPARRCEQTASVLGRKFKIREELAPGASPAQLLELVQWPTNKWPVLLIGHQPALGQTVAQLLGIQESGCTLRKGAVWWLRSREREGQSEAFVLGVQCPALL